MLLPFAPAREPAGVHATSAALPNNGGTAAGSVGVAVPLSLLAATGDLTGGTNVRRGTHFPPEMLTIPSHE